MSEEEIVEEFCRVKTGACANREIPTVRRDRERDEKAKKNKDEL